MRLDTLLVRKCHGLDFVQATTSFANALGLGDDRQVSESRPELVLDIPGSSIDNCLACLAINVAHWTSDYNCTLLVESGEITSTPQAKVAKASTKVC